MAAVKPYSTHRPNCPSRNAVTTRPRSVGTKRRSCSSTYSRSRSTARIAAQVEGRPMPSSSSRRTSPASV